MALPKRRKRPHTFVLARMEESLVTLRRLQLQGQPGAEVSLNMILEQWLVAWDRLVLESYERWALDNQSPDYHG